MKTFLHTVVIDTLMNYSAAAAAELAKAHARGQNAEIFTTSGKHIIVREKYPVREVRIAPNGMAAAWLLQDIAMEASDEKGSGTLVVERKGRRRTIACGQLIRDYWFWENGQKIAYDCGGRHFAGNEVLFDIGTLKELEHVHQAEVPPQERPAWSASGDAFSEK